MEISDIKTLGDIQQYIEGCIDDYTDQGVSGKKELVKNILDLVIQMSLRVRDRMNDQPNICTCPQEEGTFDTFEEGKICKTCDKRTDLEELTIPITFKKVWKDMGGGRSKGSLPMTHADFVAKIEDENRLVGEVIAGMGASIQIGLLGKDKNLKHTEYRASAKDIWNAYCNVTGKFSYVIKNNSETK